MFEEDGTVLISCIVDAVIFQTCLRGGRRGFIDSICFFRKRLAINYATLKALPRERERAHNYR